MDLFPLRLQPGEDLRRALVDAVNQHGAGSAFLVSGIGSLVDGRLRFSGAPGETLLDGPLEILAMSGSVTPGGAHVHLSVSDKHGKVTGGHLCFGNIVLTTVEALLVFLPGWELSRAFDPQTGFDELVIAKGTQQA